MPKENENFDAPLVEVQSSCTISIIYIFRGIMDFPLMMVTLFVH